MASSRYYLYNRTSEMETILTWEMVLNGSRTIMEKDEERLLLY